MTRSLLDDHLLRDLSPTTSEKSSAASFRAHEPATTDLSLYRLPKSVVSTRGEAPTGSWPPAQRRALGRTLLALPAGVEVVPLRTLAYRMAEISTTHRLSTLGAEAVAAAEHLDATIVAWGGDDGPAIRS
ncbi:MAG TPA: hypothetical protein VFP61_03920, partial [Acidimicrobiales bacterium]|nr:hypothetical protein [Acidimicrobiales bacterium]